LAAQIAAKAAEDAKKSPKKMKNKKGLMNMG
jgi:hypothetical protein